MRSKALDIQLILVPAGAEYWAVKRGLRRVKDAPQLVAIPAGPQGVRTFLDTWEDRSLTSKGGVLLMGLGGGLSFKRRVGDAMVLGRVWNGFEGDDVFECDPELTGQLAERLGVDIGVGVTCDRVITTVAEKRRLRDRYRADVVDMESAVLIKQQPHLQIAVLRIISDDGRSELPDIANAINADGSIRFFSMVFNFLKRPVAALSLIQGSLRGLKILEILTVSLFP